MMTDPPPGFSKPIPMLLWCPECGERHVDVGEYATQGHHTHACQHCGHVWRPAVVPTCGVQFLPGFGPDADGRDDSLAQRDFDDHHGGTG